MSKLVAALCCVLMAASPLALAQVQTAKKKPPVYSKKEIADKDKSAKRRVGDCTQTSRDKGLKAGTPEFNRYFSDCLKD